MLSRIRNRFRPSNHGIWGRELCFIYVRHWHIGPFILWSK